MADARIGLAESLDVLKLAENGTQANATAAYIVRRRVPRVARHVSGTHMHAHAFTFCCQSSR